jgi:phenylpyruvate tautomerase PptA (4-oxalocrotonate tautomerase family)
MPLVKITTNQSAPASDARALLGDLSKLLSEVLGKPEHYVMTAFEAPAQMTFAGEDGPTAYIEVKNIGKMTSEQTKRLSAEIMRRTSKALGVPSNRTYVEFADAVGYLWGHDGGTFG